MEYDFKFSAEEAQTLVDGLSELPLKKSLSVLQKLQTQFNEQNKPAEVEQILNEEK